MLKFLRTLMLVALMLPFASQAQCDAITAFPWTENFEAMDANTVPTCWDNTASGSSTLTSNPERIWGVYSYSGNKMIRMYNYYVQSGTALINTPTFDLPAGESYDLTFSYSHRASCGAFSVKVSTDNGTTFTELQSYTSTGSNDYTNPGEFTEAEISLAAYAGQSIILQFFSTANYGSGAIFVDDIHIGAPATCFKVTDLAIDATATTATSLTLTWTDARNTDATYSIYNGETVVASNVSGTTYTVTGLDANTYYTFGVMTDCGDGDVTDMVYVSGRTACAAIATLPYTMGFEDADLQGTTSALLFPFCWTRINTSTSTSYNYYPYAYSSTSAHNGGRHLYFYASSYGSYADTTGFVMPELDVTTYPMNGNRVTFWAKASSSSYPFTVLVGTMTDPTDRSTFTLAESVNVAATSYTKYTVSLASATATDAYVAFIVPKVGSTMYIDDVTLEELPSCGDIASVQIASTSTESITLRWTAVAGANGYTIYDMADNSVLGTTTDTTYTVDDLEPNTAYTLGVQSNCSGGDGLIATVSGRTACVAITIDADNLFSESFEGTAFPPDCWSTAHTDIASGRTDVWQRQTSTSDVHTGSASAKLPDMQTGNKANLVTPLFDIDEANAYMISFWMKRVSSTKPNEGVKVWVNTTPDTIGGTPLMHIRRGFAMGEITETEAGWYKYSAAIPTSGEVYIIFEGISEYGNYSSIDDIAIEVAPSCLAVTNLAVDNVTSESVTLSWADAVNSDANYSVYTITPTDTTPVESGISGTTYTVEDLTPNTPYVFGVAADCGSDQAEMVIVSTRTACSAIAIDSENTYTENFDSYTVSVSSSSAPSNYPNHEQPACWEFLNMSASSSAYPQAFMTGYSSYAVSGNCLFFKSSSSTPLYAILPDFEATTALQLQFSYRNEGTSASNGTILVGVMSDASDATTFVALDSCTRTTTITSVEVNIPAAALEDGARVAFCYRGGSSSNYYAAIDNVVVREAPSCLPVSGLTVSNVAARTATLNWSGDADGYTIYDMRDTSAYEYANDTTVVLYALDQETAYTFGVTANCGSDESDMRTVSFTTLISCPAPTNLAAALTPGNGTVATLSWHEAGEAAEWQICIDGDMENLIDVTDTAYDMTGLTPEQAVTAKVRAICGADDTSAWSSTITFTPTDAFSVTVNDGTTTNDYVPIYGLYVDNHIHSQFIIPAADLSAMAYGIVNKLTFYASNANVPWTNASFEVYLTETEATGVSSLNAVSDMTQVYTGSLSIVNNKMEVTLATPYQYMGGNLLVAFEQPTSGSYASSSWYGVSATGASMGGYGTSVNQKNFLPKMTIDYIPGEEPSCFPVSGLAASDISTDEATLIWTGDAGSYNVYSISGADTTFVQNVSDATITLTGLDAMTQYTYGVRAACGSDESDIRTVVFNTACSAVELPYTETFAAASATRNCWNLVSDNTANVGGDNGMGFVTTTEGREVLQFSSYSRDNAGNYDQYGFSPLMNVSDDATNLQVTVVYGTNTDDNLYFGYITANDTVWDPTPYNTGSSAYSTTFNWQSQTFVIPATAIQLAVHYYGDYQYYGRIDSVTVTEMTGAYCAPVTGLAATDATETSITLVWTGDAASYTVMNDTTVVATGITDTTYTVTGLTSSTTYTFSVIANCSATENSDPRSVTANTSCGTFTLPYAETFDATSASRNCWSTLDADHDGYNWSTRSLDEDTYVYTEANMMISESFNEDGALTPDNWLISPKIQTVAADTIKLGWTVYSFGNASYAAEHYAAYVSTTTADTNAFTSLGEWTLSANDNAGTRVNIDLSAYAGQEIYIAFRHFNCTDMYYMGIDSVTVTAINGSTPQPQVEEATIAASAVTYWVGTGSNQVVMAVNWADTALAWGVNFSTDSITSQAALDTIAANDPRFSWTTGSYGLGNITFTENGTTLTGDATHFWESKRNTISDMGLSQNLGNDDFQKWANSAAGVVVDSMEFSGVWYYMHNYPMTIYPVTAPQPGPQPADSIVVTFATNDATLGTTNPAPGTYTYHAGDTIYFNAIATTGNSFVEWIIDYGNGTADTVGAEYATGYYFLASTLMGYGITNMTFNATFQAGAPAPDSISVTYTVNDAVMGTITPNGTIRQAVGSTISASATANDGYRIHGWRYTLMVGNQVYNDTTFVTATTSASFGTIPQNYATAGASVTITAIFEAGAPDSVAVTYTVNDSTMGSINPSGTVMTAVGDSIAATATANAGYELYGWRFTVYVNGAVASDTTLAIVETSVNFGTLPQFYAEANATVTITAMFQQQVGIEDADISNVNVYSANSTIYVRGAEGQSVYVFDVNGRMLNHEAKASESCSFRMENTGVYLVKVGNAAAQRVIVVR